jgi:glycosyltransferase involved in cell wall biosynthesis
MATARIKSARILIPISAFGSSGGYRVLSELANHWTDLGARVDFLVDQRTTPPYFPTRAGIRYFDARGREVSAADRQGSFSAYNNAWSIYTGMTRAIASVGDTYDIIVANQSLTALPVFLGAHRRATRIYYVQAYEPEYYALERGVKSLVLRMLSWLSYRLPMQQIANAPIYVEYKGIRATAWIPPGVDENVFHQRSEAPSIGIGNELTLGVIGRREPAKGTVYVLQAFEELARRHDNVRLRVAFGNLPDGWDHPRCEVVQPKGDRELADFYRSVDVLIAPGTVQLGACHYPVLEAMSCGTPVITTGYLPANDRNAWIVPVKDAKAIVGAVEELMQTSRSALNAKLETAASDVSQFHWSAVAPRFLALITAS